MTVYVDPAANPFGRMMMCHMWADTEAELMAMVDTIGVARKWVQRPPKASWLHFDISKGKRELAVRAGALETDRYGPVEFQARQLIASQEPDLVAIGKKKLAMVSECRALHRQAKEA